MPIPGAIIVSHPPIIIPTVGRGRERKGQATIDAYRAAAKQVADWLPEVLIIPSPHTVMYGDYSHISPGQGASGSMSAFGASRTRLEAPYDGELRAEFIRQAKASGIRAGTLGGEKPCPGPNVIKLSPNPRRWGPEIRCLALNGGGVFMQIR